MTDQRPQGKEPSYPYEKPRTNSKEQLVIRKAALNIIIDRDRPNLSRLASSEYQRYIAACDELKTVNYQLGIRS